MQEKQVWHTYNHRWSSPIGAKADACADIIQVLIGQRGLGGGERKGVFGKWSAKLKLCVCGYETNYEI